MKILKIILLQIVVFTFFPFLSFADKAEEGRVLYLQKACQSCHGDEGRNPVLKNYPKLAGQNKQYLMDQIRYINNGTRNGGWTGVMKGISSQLTNEEIDKITDYLSKQAP